MPDVHEIYDEADKLKEDGKFQEAADKLHELLEIDPTFALAHAALSVVYGKLGEHEKAVEHGQKVCELEPGEAFSFTAMSVTYQRAFAGTGNQAYIQLAEEAMARAHMIQGGM